MFKQLVSLFYFLKAGNPTAVSDVDKLPVDTGLTGLAKEAKQLPDNHNVNVSNQVQQPLTDAQLRASPVNVNTGLSQGLTDTQLRASPVVVNTNLIQPTTPLDTQPVSVQNQITGFATSAKQLPDNHNVTVSNQIQQPLTDAQLRASPVNVNTGIQQPTRPTDIQPVSLTSVPLPSGAATEAKQLPNNHQVQVSNFPSTQNVQVNNFPVKQDISDSTDTEYLKIATIVTNSGDNLLVTPASGKRIRLRWVYAINDPVASTSTKITIKLGNEIQYVAWAISKRQQLTGPVDGQLIVNLSNAGDVAVTIFYEEI